MKALRVVSILALLGMLALSVPAAADEGPGVAEAPLADVVHFLPIVGDLSTGIEIMNVGTAQTFVDIWYYSPAGAVVAKQENIPINGLSSVTIYPVPVTSASSAVVVSFDAKTAPAHPADLPNYTYGSDIATMINRLGSGGKPSASYTGVGAWLLPADDSFGGVPYAGQDTYWIYAPVVQKANNGWNSTIWIQHAYLGTWWGQTIMPMHADADIYFYTRDGGLPVAQANLYIPPFASVQLPVPMTLGAGVYSAWIRSNGPIVGVADQYNSPTLGDDTGIFMSYRASPKNKMYGGAPDPWGGMSAAAFNFGPLIFSQHNGWESGIAVVNTDENFDADVVATFRAKDGTVLQTLNTTLEERSMWTIYPLSAFGLPADQVGSVSIESQVFCPPGGGCNRTVPVLAVVNQFNEGESKGSAYNAFRAVLDLQDGDWAGLDTASYLAAPLMMKYNGGTALNTGWSTGIVVMNTDLDSYVAERIELDFWDAAGGPVPINFVQVNLRGGTTHVIDMRFNTGNTIPPGWVGSCTVDSRIGDVRPPIAAVVNEIYDAPAGAAQVAGDFFMTYEAYPLGEMAVCVGDIFGKVHNIDPCQDGLVNHARAIEGARVSAPGVEDPTVYDLTDSTGDYEVEDVKAGDAVEVTFSATGFLPYTKSIALECGEDEELSAELLCLGKIKVLVESNVGVTGNDATDTAEPGALVEYYVAMPTKASHYPAYNTSGTTDATGVVTLTVPLISKTATITVSKESVFETGTFEWNSMFMTVTAKTNSEASDEPSALWDGFAETDCPNIYGGVVTKNQTSPTERELDLCALGTISGKVWIDLNTSGGFDDGEGIAGFTIDAIYLGTVVRTTTTGSNGAYQLPGLPTGVFNSARTYTIRAEKAGYATKDTTKPFTECGQIIKAVDFEY